MMKYKELQFRHLIFTSLLAGILILFSADFSFAQSTSVDFPTAVSTNEISGSIAARDLGDARLTSYYYKFDGSQGDVFINVSVSNFTGDIDIFVADGLRPLTKISFYADSNLTESGRVVYLRKSEKLILRVQGRSPDDNPATFRIKFAGSFVAVQDSGENEEPKLPEIKTESGSGIKVNSVGTIIEVKPTPAPESKETAAQAESTDSKSEEEKKDSPKALITELSEAEKTEITDEKVTADDAKKETTSAAKPTGKTPVRRTARNTRRTATGKPPVKTAPPVAETTPPSTTNPLENVHLVVLLKNGEKIEFPMTEVFRFSMNNGILTVITKSGKIIRHPILDIQKMTVE